jgi:hypothetical protein
MLEVQCVQNHRSFSRAKQPLNTIQVGQFKNLKVKTSPALARPASGLKFALLFTFEKIDKKKAAEATSILLVH